jgi:tetrahydrodipicolinate N-succinyltransferase
VATRVIAELLANRIENISVFADSSVAPPNAGVDPSLRVSLSWTENAWSDAGQQVLAYKESGVEAVLIIRVGAYAEFDVADALQFHREQAQLVTRAFAQDGPLDIWIVDPTLLPESEKILRTLSDAEPARYQVRGYVNRLERAQDLRQFVVDGFSSRSRLSPAGSEARPGVWIDEGAQVHRDARIVAPAYIGRGARIAEQCLITRCSNVEANCQVDYGTVVEDSSILSNTYVGIGLDLSHSIVEGSNLVNLERGVTLEIADPCVIRQNRSPRTERNRPPAIFGLGAVHLAPAEEGTR